MKRWIAASAAIASGAVSAVVLARAGSRRRIALEEVFSDDNFQITGVTMSKLGRLFVNYPRWSDLYLNAVVEVLPNRAARRFPDERWNGWDRKPYSAADHFVCVQSVVVDDDDQLWVLDPAAPMLTSPVPGGAKLVKIDLRSDRVTQVIRFGPDVVRADSYLNDVRIDLRTQTAYITDSGAGGIVVLDLGSGRAHRVLDGHPSVLPRDYLMNAAGRDMVVLGVYTLRIGVDSIALDRQGEWLYYGPLNGDRMFRIATAALDDASLAPDALAAKVEDYGPKTITDGLSSDDAGNVYLTDPEHSAVLTLGPDRKLTTLIKDPKLRWPDGLSFGPDGWLYVTCSALEDVLFRPEEEVARHAPYQIWRFKPGTTAAPGH